jgi:hypothetical protein
MAQAGDLARLLQLRARAALAESEMPARIGSAELSVRGPAAGIVPSLAAPHDMGESSWPG